MNLQLNNLLETLAAWYGEPLFLLLPLGGNLVALAAFLLMSWPLTLLALKNPAWAAPYLIQKRRLNSYGNIIDKSVKQLLINFALMSCLSVLSWPVLRLTGIHAGPLPAWYVVVGQVLLFTVLDDFLYYWAHRLMHSNKFLYSKVHSVHHRITTPVSITGNYLHPVEFVMISSMVLIGPILLSSHILTVWIWIVVRQWEAAEQHSGYSFPWNPMHWLPFYDGAAFHDFHHTKFIGNYAGLFSWTDKLFKTLSKNYAEYRSGRTGAASEIEAEPFAAKNPGP